MSIPTEIERKFLLINVPAEVLAASGGRMIEQGYLVTDSDGNEVRIRRAGGRCSLAVKCGSGLERTEVEVALANEAFEDLWAVTHRRRVFKTRYDVPLAGELLAEVDVYAGALDGLATVEVEFGSVAAARAFVAPEWFGPDVTDRGDFKNRALATFGLPADI